MLLRSGDRALAAAHEATDHAIKASDDRIGDTDIVHARDDVQPTSPTAAS
jgi:hypothetical protein